VDEGGGEGGSILQTVTPHNALTGSQDTEPSAGCGDQASGGRGQGMTRRRAKRRSTDITLTQHVIAGEEEVLVVEQEEEEEEEEEEGEVDVAAALFSRRCMTSPAVIEARQSFSPKKVPNGCDDSDEGYEDEQEEDEEEDEDAGTFGSDDFISEVATRAS